MLFLNEKARKIMARVGLVFGIALIFLLTIYRRNPAIEYEVALKPFASLRAIMAGEMTPRTLIFNIMLFMPFGFSFPFAVPEKIRHKVLITVVLGFVMSAAVETTQLIFNIGMVETDDVIMNTLGTFIGTTSYMLIRAADRFREKRKQL